MELILISLITKVAWIALTALIANSVFAQRDAFFDIRTNTLYADGVFVEGVGVYDLILQLNPTLGTLQLTGAESATTANANNRFDAEGNVLFFEFLGVGAGTFFIVLPVVQLAPTVEFGIGEYGRSFDPRFQKDWTVNYSGNFPDDMMSLNPDGSASVATFPGSVTVSKGNVLVDLVFSIFRAGVDAFWIAGDYDHQNEEGTFTVTPANTGTTLETNAGRFRTTVEWQDGSQSGMANAVLLTDNSGAFFFSDPSNIDLVIRTLDGCGINERYWVFAGATTNVEYTVTVTDTQTSTSMEYNNGLEDSAGTFFDDSAFAACP